MARWRNQEDGLTEKSRDMGVSWLCVAAAVEFWLFHPGMAIGFGSRKEELVDRVGDPKSLFEKIRQYLRNLPVEFLPWGIPDGESAARRYNERKDATHMKVVNIENGATITGEAGDNIGRGARASIYFKDESAFYERPDRIDAALSQTSNCKIDVSTPNGTGNPFYLKRMGGKIPVFTFHWRDDPRKDDEWYQKQVDTLDAVTVAQEIDIDYTASVSGVVIPAKWVRAAIGLAEKLGLEPSGVKRIGLDVADEEGADDNVATVVEGTVVSDIEAWKGVDTSQSAAKTDSLAHSVRAEYVNFDSIGVGAGIRGAGKALSTEFHPVASSESPEHGYCLDNDIRKRSEQYLNLRAQLWWEMRIRCQRAYQHVNGDKLWSLDDMVSLPNHPQLITELSQPLFAYTASGKVQIESKKEMARRGLKSPNYADSLLLAFAEGPDRTTIEYYDDYEPADSFGGY